MASTSDEVLMDTAEPDPSASQETALLDYEDVVVEHKPRVIEKRWAKWTEDDLQVLSDYVKYHMDCVEFYNKCWARGPSKERPPKAPISKIENLLKKKYRKAAPSKSSKSSKDKLKSVNEMNDEEFHYYLRERIEDNVPTEPIPDLISTKLESVAEYLNSLHKEVKKSESSTLAHHIKLGVYLIKAQEIFNEKKIKTKTKETWEGWVSNNTTISSSYARQHKEIAALVVKYPKLARLGMSFRELFQMKNKIRNVLTINIHLGEFWKE